MVYSRAHLALYRVANPTLCRNIITKGVSSHKTLSGTRDGVVIRGYLTTEVIPQRLSVKLLSKSTLGRHIRALHCRSESCRYAGVLIGERSMSTSTLPSTDINTRHKQMGQRKLAMPRTLRPELIIAGQEELCDLSYKFRPTLYASDQKSPIVSYGYSDSEQKVFRFPPNTKGYFYFHRSPDLPELLWGVRFRICDGPEDFERGHDLLSRSGTPWGYTVIALVYDSFRRPFLELAEAEHFIEEDLVRDIKKLGLDDARRMASFLYSLADPFILNLAKPKVIVTIITRKRVATVRFLTTRFAERRKSKDGKMQKPIYPLIGSIKVQLELSTLPEHKSLGPTLVFRILEVIEPVTVNPDYTVDPSYTESTVALPEPGTLMYRLYKGERRIVKIPIRRQKMGADILKLANEAWPTAVL